MKPLRVPFDTLVSFHYFRGRTSEPVIAEIAAAGCRTIGDSGAFSAMASGVSIDLDEFAAWAERNRRHLAWVASLDVIGDPSASWRNWLYLNRNGLDVVPTVHFGARPEELDRYADRGCDFIGLGGVAARRDRQRVLRWLVSMFRHARDHHPGMRFHGWGITSRLYLDHLPFYSADSSGFTAGYRYAKVSVWDPDQARLVGFDLDRVSSAPHWRLLRRVYGVSALDVATSTAANRSLLVRLAALTSQAMTDHYTRRHRVAPPASQHLTGTRVHIVLAHTDYQRLVAALPGVRVNLADTYHKTSSRDVTTQLTEGTAQV